MLLEQRLELRQAGTAVRAGLEADADVGRGRAPGLDGFEDRRLANTKAGAYLSATVATTLRREAGQQPGAGGSVERFQREQAGQPVAWREFRVWSDEDAAFEFPFREA